MYTRDTTKADAGVLTSPEDHFKSPQFVMGHGDLRDESNRGYASQFIVPYLLKNSSDFRVLCDLRQRASNIQPKYHTLINQKIGMAEPSRR